MWDETLVPLAEMGSYIVTARRSGHSWWVGAETSWQPRQLALPLGFLAPGKSYEATILADGPNANHTATDYAVATRRVTAADTLTLSLAAGGGALVRITEKDNSEN